MTTATTLTPEQVGTLIGVCKKTVLRRLADGSIPAKRLGKRWIISASRIGEQFGISPRAMAIALKGAK